jgi:hypothetical protein
VEVNGTQIPVTVAACPTVLAVLDALAAVQTDGRYVVVLTPCDTRDVGDSVLARALQPEIKPINRWDLVQEAFGANQLDPVLAKSGSAWVAEALLDAQPGDGWRRLSGTVLTGLPRSTGWPRPGCLSPTPTTRRSTRPPCSNGRLTPRRWRASIACAMKSVRD